MIFIDKPNVASWLGLALLLTCCFLTVILFSEIKARENADHKAAYAVHMGGLHKSIHCLRDAWWSLQQPSFDENTIKLHMRSSLNEFAGYMAKVRRVPVNAVVKDVFTINNYIGGKEFFEQALKDKQGADFLSRLLVVVTLCRTEDKPEPKEYDIVADNLDYRSIYENPKDGRFRYYFSNDISKERGYYDSHISADELNSGKLPYFSVFVWPIRKKLEEPGALGVDHDLLGFLCLNSPHKNAFLRKVDFEVGALYADALYSFIQEWRKKKEVKSTSSSPKT